MKQYGSQSMSAPLQTVLVRRPDATFGKADPTQWHYTSQPDLAIAQAEHDALVEILRQAGANVVYHDAPMPNHADAIFTHDPVLICDKGAIILKMGKELRQGEEEAIADRLAKLDIPIHYRLHGDARAEGGDLLWLDSKTLAVGQGFRTNAEGLRQLQEALPDVEVMPVPLPYFQGEAACLHLMSFISVVDGDLAVVYPPLMPVPFWQELQRRGFEFVEVPEEEFATMGPNVLALAPRQCVMLAGNPITQERLEAAGCTVQTYKGNEISLKAEGGATCLTRPLLRQTTHHTFVNPHLDGDSFFWEGGEIGVLLLHGLTATTAEVRLLAEELHAQGYTIVAPLLPGHGTVPEDLNKVTWQDWAWTCEMSYQLLATHCEQVFVGGESTGGVLALYLATQHPDIAGVLAYAPAIKLKAKLPDRLKLYMAANFMEFVPKEGSGYNPYWQGYDVLPLKGAMELVRLGKEVTQNLSKITQPVLVVQGRHDDTVADGAGKHVLDGVKSAIKEHYWMEESGHIIILEDERDAITALTLKFMERAISG